MGSAANTKVRRLLFVAGESPLVEEYASAALGAGMDVAVRWNPGRKGTLPGGAMLRARPPRQAALGIELTNTSAEAKRSNLALMERALPEGTPLLSAAAAISLAEQAAWMRRPERLVGIGALPSMLKGGLVEIAQTGAGAAGAVGVAREFFAALGKETSLIRGSPGMVLPRILCMIVNEASFALGDRIARRADIDTAMKLGTHYPLGPLEWGEALGPDHVRAVLEGLRREFGEERYRTAPLLARPEREQPRNQHKVLRREHHT